MAERAARPSTAGLSVALLVALAGALAGLLPAFTDAGWYFVTLGLAVAVTFVVAAVRALSRFRIIPLLAGWLVVVIGLGVLFAPETLIGGVVPTLATPLTFLAHVMAAIESIATQAIPIDPDTGIVFVVAAGVGVVVMFLDWLAIVVRRPAFVGVPLLALVIVPSLFDPTAADPVAFVIAALGYLLVLYVGAGERRPGGAIAVAAVTVTGALLLPIVLPPVGDEPLQGESGLVVQANTFIALGDDLRQPNPSRVLTYVTDDGAGEYLTLATITNFSGGRWAPSRPEDYDTSLDEIDRAPGLGPDVPIDGSVTSVRLTSLSSRWLPVPYAPTRVEGMGEEWNWNPIDRTVSTVSGNARGATYIVRSEVAVPSMDALRAASGPHSEALDRFLVVPNDLDETVTEAARTVTVGASNDFDRAMALQEWFTGGDFEYSETAPVEGDYDGTSAGVVGRFLEERSGYCVHFSSAMAVMARSLGIPARIAVGFTPGEYVEATEDKDGFWAVSTSNLHAWPELWFDGIGWMRFEPTPGRGELPDFTGGSALPTATPAPSASVSLPPTAAPAPSPSGTPSFALDDGGLEAPDLLVPQLIVGALALAVFAILLSPLLPIVVRGVRRLARLVIVARRGSAVAAWRELNDTAIDLGWQAETMTPREFALLVRRGMPRRSVDALARLLAAIETTAYSRQTARARSRDVLRVLGGMWVTSTRHERVQSVFAPRSGRRRR